MADVISTFLFSSATVNEQILKFQLAMRSWQFSILNDKIVGSSDAQKKKFINNWLNEFETTFKKQETKINILSGQKGAALASTALASDIISLDDFINIYRDRIILYSSVDWAKARMLRNDLATRIKDYNTFYDNWEKYLQSASADGLGQIEKVDYYLSSGGKEFTGLRDTSNRLWKPDRYASMYAKTRGSEAYDVFTQETYVSNGGDVVQISAHNTTTPMCQQFEGKFYSLTGATKSLPTLRYRPPFHPNCKHRVLPRTSVELSVMKSNNTSITAKVNSEKIDWTESTFKTIAKQQSYLSKNRPTMATI